MTFESILADMYSSSVSNPGFNVSAREGARLTAVDLFAGMY